MVTHTLLKPIYFKQLAFPRGFVERTAADVVLAQLLDGEQKVKLRSLQDAAKKVGETIAGYSAARV